MSANNKDCGHMNCITSTPPNNDNLHIVFPDLHVRPRPRPAETNKSDHDMWLKEYEEWRNLTCPCGEGYFCQAHGSWVSGEQVRSGLAATAKEQNDGSCPASHYEAGYDGVTTYIGAREAVHVPDQES